MAHQLEAKYIAGVALGGVVFNYIYISLNFLRMGTTGLISQNLGSEDNDALEKNLIVNTSLAIILGFVIIIFSYPIMTISGYFFSASIDSENLMKEYISIRIFSAPAVLINMVFLGCFFGLGAPKSAMVQLITICVTNAILDLVFVFQFSMSIDGVAYASLIAEYLGLTISSVLLWKLVKEKISFSFLKQIKNIALVKKNYDFIFNISKNLFIRTLLLISAEGIIINKSASMGDNYLAATQIIIVFFGFISYGLDGFAHAAETLTGQAIGQKNKNDLYKIMINSLLLGFVFSIMISLFVYNYGVIFIEFISPLEEVNKIIKDLFYIIVLLPLIGVWAFLMDGFFVGAADSKSMRDSTILAFVFYLILINIQAIYISNLEILWTIFLIYLLLRSFFLCFYIRNIFIKAEK